DRLDAAQCSQSLGNILRPQGNYSEATAILMDTRAQFVEIRNHMGAAECSHPWALFLSTRRTIPKRKACCCTSGNSRWTTYSTYRL
ncbi:hypothetical protein FIBSPDRAFT_727851, partial [Athelia psychrophila]